ncbi:MAG TPA: ABC transporter ATP-binding protein [Deinococcales bacterium]|nr:ABC transporter ATP-binding protein [Deinococcales bacterium]
MNLSDPAIRLDHLVVKYGQKPAVNDLNLAVPEGSIFGLLGPNGAGKTTTIKTLLGLRRPDGGRAVVLGQDVAEADPRARARVGFVAELGGLFDFMNVEQSLRYWRETTPGPWNDPAARGYVQRFGLPLTQRVGSFSKGMKMQLAFALAMGGDPSLLLLDEPTSGLDPVARHELLNTLTGEAAAGRTVLFSSHILSEVEAVADRIAIIREGHCILTGDLDDLKEHRKAVSVSFDGTPGAELLKAIGRVNGVRGVMTEGRAARVRVQGDPQKVMTALRALNGVRDVTVLDLNLEDLFLDLMQDPPAATRDPQEVPA